jgi:hypothetical protein
MVRKVSQQLVSKSVKRRSVLNEAQPPQLRRPLNEPPLRLLIWNEGPPPDFKKIVKAPPLLLELERQCAPLAAATSGLA